jgi:hypothetical protein
MKIEHSTLFAEPKLLNSVEAEQGAKRLLKRIDSEEMTMEVLPNNCSQFSGEQEERDFISYCRFLESANGKKIIQMLEEIDGRKYVEL